MPLTQTVSIRNIIIYISAIYSCLNPMLRFILFSICICKFTHKIFFVASFPPCFHYLGPNRSWWSPHLVSKWKNLFFWKLFWDDEDFLSNIPCFLINNQISEISSMRVSRHHMLPSYRSLLYIGIFTEPWTLNRWTFQTIKTPYSCHRYAEAAHWQDSVWDCL